VIKTRSVNSLGKDFLFVKAVVGICFDFRTFCSLYVNMILFLKSDLLFLVRTFYYPVLEG
jgi:hypothetical protein